MTTAFQFFIAFLAIGLLLIAIEVFVPGGILGVFGGLALFAAVIAGFYAFGPQGGFVAAVALVVFSGLFLALWIKLLPRTRVGRTLSLHKDGRTFKSAAPEFAALLGHEGTAQTHLHPAGIALIDDRRTDVVSETGFIASGAHVRVVRVEGNRIVVREVAAA